MNNVNSMVSYVIGLIAMLSEKRICKCNNQRIRNIKIKSTFMVLSNSKRNIYILSMARTGIRKLRHIWKIKICDG